MLWQNIRLLKDASRGGKLPKYLMFENVKNLISKKFIGEFNNLLGILDDIGFHTYWSVLNGKECGVPQNRERVFVICIRKDIDTEKFTFPKPFDTGIRLKDILEDNVDEKYYINTEGANNLIDKLIVDGKLDDLDEPKKRITGLFSDQCTKMNNEIDCVCTLLQRDYKGFANQAMNGVIENNIEEY